MTSSGVLGADGVAGRHLDLGDFALVRRRHLHGGLVALDTDDRLFLFDLIAHGHVDIGHVDLVSADIGQGNFLSDDHRFSRLFFLVSWLGFDHRRIALGGIEHQHERAGGDGIADGDLDFRNRAGLGGGHLHGGLVALDADEGRVHLDRVADIDENLGNIRRVCPDIR